MTEREMEDLLWDYPEILFKEPLAQYRRQAASGVSRADLVFTDSLGRLLVVEVKKGILPRSAISQTIDHFGGMKLQHPDKAIEMMVVANQIPPERKVALANYHIEWREIPEPRYREVAAEKGYVFNSEQLQPGGTGSPAGVATDRRGQGNRAGPDVLGPEGWVKVVWKDDCADSLRKESRAQKLYGDSWHSTEIHGMILTRLRDQQVHCVSDLGAEVGGAASDVREKIKHVAHRGNCTERWSIHRSPDWKYTRMTLSKEV